MWLTLVVLGCLFCVYDTTMRYARAHTHGSVRKSLYGVLCFDTPLLERSSGWSILRFLLMA